ncbi:MAG: flavodoxin family protein [Proteobacteria bacterium]|nr:flavodoxin family protein [Pseudomonadota bacterium]
MKIVVLTGSPRKNGNTNYMADRFIAGAHEAGHEVFRFDCAKKDVSLCIGCNHCNMNGPCIYDDDFTQLRPKLIEADLVAFVSPMYYFGFSAQLKRVIDRFYAINGQIKGGSKKAVFMMAYADTAKSEAEAMTAHYKTMIKYLGWKDAGMVIAPGVWTAGAIKNTKYGDEAYKLGREI